MLRPDRLRSPRERLHSPCLRPEGVHVQEGRLERADFEGVDRVKGENHRRGDFSERIFNPNTRIVRAQPLCGRAGDSASSQSQRPRELMVALHLVLSAPNPQEAARNQSLPANALLRADSWIIDENGKRISPVRDLDVIWVSGQLTALVDLHWDFNNKDWSWTRGELTNRVQVVD